MKNIYRILCATVLTFVVCISVIPANAGSGPGGPGNEVTVVQAEANKTTGVGSVNLLGANVNQTPNVAAAAASASCGNVSGYALVGQYAIYDLGVRKGTLMICWSSTAGRNSALNYCYNNCGVRHVREVGIGVADAVYWIDDSEIGNFYYYAGPVYSGPSRGKCIKAYAQTDYGPINNYGPFHCG